jgi:hypothetical protein
VVAPIELLDRALDLTTRCGRQDLHRRLALVRERAQDPSVRVLVVGQPRQGKSQLVNALVGAPVCGVRDDTTTVVPTVVREGPAPSAALVFAPRTGSVDAGTDPDSALDRTPVPVESLPAQLAAAADADSGRLLVQADVQLPRRLLAGGLHLVDTPGVGGIDPALSLRTLDMLPRADAVVVVSDASQEFTAPEIAFLRQAAALCPTVVCVLTKTDANPHWRTIAALDRNHLAAAGIEAPLFPVSASLELLAVQRQDRELHEESAIGTLSEHLRTEVVDRAGALARRATAHDLASVTEQLTLALRTELAALQDPARNQQLVEELAEARARVDNLGRQSSRWQQLLNDGVTDLMADIDYDLRDRARVVIREAEEAIEAEDPGPLWDTMADWLDQRVAVAVADSYVWATQRAEWLGDQVIEQFSREGGAEVPGLAVGDPAAVLGALVDVSDIDRGDMTMRERMLIGLRGSYTGVLMTGLVTSLAGMALLNPISLAAGVVLGRKAYKDDRTTRRQRRETEAKAAVRRHMDEVVFQVSKQLKDRLRQVQRTLRDLITTTVEEMTRTLAEALRATQQAAKAATAERDERLRALRRQLDEVERLAQEVPRLTAAAVPAR